MPESLNSLPTTRRSLTPPKKLDAPGGASARAVGGNDGIPASLRNRPLVGVGTVSVERAVLTNPTYHNKITMYPGADESREALLNAIQTAKSSFYIETFIWHNDVAGREIAQALIERKQEAAKRGEAFDVKVLIDNAGLHDASNPTDDTEIYEFMKKNGIDVRLFNKAMVNPLATGRTPITHRKLYIQDGAQFFTGGRNIGDEYLKSTFIAAHGGEERAWHDLLYSVRGDETGRVLDQFFLNWARSGGKMPESRPVVIPALDGTAQVQSFTTDPLLHTHEILNANLKAIANAKREIIVVYPYLSDDTLINALCEAKLKNPNLSLKVMIPATKEKGVSGFLYSKLNLESAARLLAAGAEVREVETHHEGNDLVKTFSHLKAMVFDGKLISVGSANGDQRTMRDNHELNTMIFDPKVVSQFKQDVLLDDWESGRPLTVKELRARSLTQKLFGWLLEQLDFLF